MIRTHEAGRLRPEHVGETVTLAGWVARRRDHGGVSFVDLRDGSGIAQVVIRDEESARPLRSEFCILVTGEVATRPAGNANPSLPSGDIEVIATRVEVLSESAPLPFPIEEHHATPVSEEVRLAHRYLDLRRPAMAANIRLRATVTRIIREVMADHDFLDIETPYLTRSTPEGARDFLVPVRLQPGSWYALPQSPQLFKQLLMVAGMERYFQIARCFRDEDFRADRQPEFSQLDIELSFCTPEDVQSLIEELLVRLWRDIHGYEITLPIPRMTYDEAMRRYGIDRPDLRFGCELVDFTSYFADTPFRVFQSTGDDFHVGAVVMPGGAAQARRELDGWQDWARSRGARGLAYVIVGADGELTGPVAKNLSEAERTGLAAHAGAAPGDCVFFAAGRRSETLGLLAAARLEVGERCGLIDETAWEFVWVVDAPMFEAGRARGRRPRMDRDPSSVHGADGRRGRQFPAGSRLGAVQGVRHRAQRLGDRRRLDPDPPRRDAAPGLRGDRTRCRRGTQPVRLPAGRLRLRSTAPRRDRARDRPAVRPAVRRGLDSGGDRLPEGGLGRGSAHRRPDAHHACSAR